LGIEYSDQTDDRVTVDAANAIAQYGVGVKCATITRDVDPVKEFNHKRMYHDPNGTWPNTLDYPSPSRSHPPIIKRSHSSVLGPSVGSTRIAVIGLGCFPLVIRMVMSVH